MPVRQPPYEVAAAINRVAPGALALFMERLNRSHYKLQVVGTSWWRSPDSNERARAVRTSQGLHVFSTSPYSQHLVALGFDAVYPNAKTKALAKSRAQALGLIAIDEGDHVHYQLFPKGVLERAGAYRAIGLA